MYEPETYAEFYPRTDEQFGHVANHVRFFWKSETQKHEEFNAGTCSAPNHRESEKLFKPGNEIFWLWFHESRTCYFTDSNIFALDFSLASNSVPICLARSVIFACSASEFRAKSIPTVPMTLPEAS